MLYFYLSLEQKKYLNDFMNMVSRSFAAVTPCFEEPLDDFMSVAYLICRVVDNIEDCKNPFIWQQSRFVELKDMLKSPSLAHATLSEWSQQDWIGLDVHQQKLMSLEEGLVLWQIYEQIPKNAQAIITHWTTSMANGMEKILDPHQEPLLIHIDGVDILASEKDYNDYCYVVAGTVGRMGTELAINQYSFNSEITNDLLLGSETCGRALQKTNILKDFVEDLRQNKCYLPYTWLQEINFSPLKLDPAPQSWIHKILCDVKAELDTTVSYVTAIPYSAVGYRLASLMCLLPAYQTLLSAVRQQESLFTANHDIKISRSCFAQCMEDAKLMVQDNLALVSYSQQVHAEIMATLHQSFEDQPFY